MRIFESYSAFGQKLRSFRSFAELAKGYPDVGEPHPELVQMGLKHFAEGSRLVAMAVAESPEMKARQRRKELEHH